MARYLVVPDASSLSVWTEKEGLLSTVAHDLEIAATGFSVAATVEGGKFSVRVVVPVSGLKVKGAVKRGIVAPLAEKDHREIEATLAGTVLDAGAHPEIVYEGQGQNAADADATGSLTLRGKTVSLPVSSHVSGVADEKRVEGVVRFKQTAFGVKPYSAMLGTLRVKDELRVSWSLVLRKE
jgi:hypothetical protein